MPFGNKFGWDYPAGVGPGHFDTGCDHEDIDWEEPEISSWKLFVVGRCKQCGATGTLQQQIEPDWENIQWEGPYAEEPEYEPPYESAATKIFNQLKIEEEKWMQKAFAHNKGALHRQLGVPEDETIPKSKLNKAAKAKGKLGQRARAAKNAIAANEENKGTCPGIQSKPGACYSTSTKKKDKKTDSECPCIGPGCSCPGATKEKKFKSGWDEYKAKKAKKAGE